MTVFGLPLIETDPFLAVFVKYLHGRVVLGLHRRLGLQLGYRRPHRVNVLRQDAVLRVGNRMCLSVGLFGAS